ncbi:MAG: hypothetical protein VYC39_11760 [Myxococcota bacterium]|nr:hypothetical protein [Myxococcota bacterium]
MKRIMFVGAIIASLGLAFCINSSDAKAKKNKNLTVLDKELGKKVGKGMKHLTKGLGVKCVSCHVKGKMAEDGVPNKEHTREFIKAVLKNPAAKEAALAKLLKDMKLEKAKKPEKVWKAFEIWK